MVRLERRGLAAPATWKATVEKHLPDPQGYWDEAAAFEKLSVAERKARKGFKGHAKQMLPGPEHDFPPVWREDGRLKEALSAMSDGHCAYCQASVSDNHPGAVEHFKPKSLFPLLAYAWDNYLFSCERCNTAKSNKWPDDGEYVRPDDGDPAPRFVFTRRGRVRGAARDAAARRTVQDFGLNRPKLCERRAQAIGVNVRALRVFLELPGLTESQRHELAKTQIVDRLSSYSEAINQNVRRVWEQALLPSPAG